MQELSAFPTPFSGLLGKNRGVCGKRRGKTVDFQKNIKVHKFADHKLVNFVFFHYICTHNRTCVFELWFKREML